MPPILSGWNVLLSRPWTIPSHTRHVSSELPKPMKRQKVPKYKTSPIEGRVKPQARKPTRVATNVSDAVLPETRKPSRFAQLISRIPPAYRRTIGNTLIFAPFVGLVWLHFPLQIMYTNGGSMAPFFNPNASPDLPETKDKILVHFSRYPSRKSEVTPLDTVEGTSLRRGEVVVFRTPHDPSRIAVKRIVGIPGDRVQPLPGYEGGSEAVVVPYNQLWVEGDVDNRNKSVDSNWYGPISQSLVLGKVIALMEPWYSPKSIKIEEHSYPAKEKGRVEENVVKDAMVDPDTLDRSQAYRDGRLSRDMEMIKGDLESTVLLIKTNEKQRKKAVEYYKSMSKELAKGDPMTVEAAMEMVALLEEVLVKAGYERDDLRKFVGRTAEEEHAELKNEMEQEDPFMQIGTLPVHEMPERAPKEVEEGPAAKALREHQEKIQKDREDGVPNGLDDSDRQDMWKRQDRIMRENAERIKAESAQNRAQVDAA